MSGGLAGALPPGSPPVGDCLGRPLSPVLLTGGYQLAGTLQPASYNPMRETISAMAGQAGTDRWIMTGGMFLVAGCYLVTAAGLNGARASARTLLVAAGLAWHRHRRISRTRPRRDPAAPRLDRARCDNDSRMARLRRPAHLTTAADPDRLRLRRRLHCPARLAVHRNPRRQRSGPGRAAHVIDPDLLAIHHRRHPAPHPAASSRRRAGPEAGYGNDTARSQEPKAPATACPASRGCPNQERFMTLTDPWSGEDDSDYGYCDTPSGNIWRPGREAAAGTRPAGPRRLSPSLIARTWHPRPGRGSVRPDKETP